MTQHTPGPWITIAALPTREGIQIWDTVEGYIIADVVDDQHDNSEANATLIAASPLMLEALQYALSDDDPEAEPLAPSVEAKIRAAIEATKI